jgi:hypothetical protein
MSAADYLSDAWFAAAGERVAAASFASSTTEAIAFSYEITDVPRGHPKAGSVVRYRVEINPGAGTAVLSQSGAPGDVRFAMSFDVAFAVATGTTSGGRAFLDGSIRLGGDVAALIERAADLRALNGLIGAGDA